LEQGCDRSEERGLGVWATLRSDLGPLADREVPRRTRFLTWAALAYRSDRRTQESEARL